MQFSHLQIPACVPIIGNREKKQILQYQSEFVFWKIYAFYTDVSIFISANLFSMNIMKKFTNIPACTRPAPTAIMS